MKTPSIRTILLLTLGTLTLFIALLAGGQVWRQWSQLENIRTLKEAMFFGDQLFDAMEKLSTERDEAFILLHAPDGEDTDDLRLRLKDARRNSDDAFNASMGSLTHYSFQELADLRDKITAHLKTIRDLRGQIDQAALLPKAQRPRTLSGRWYEEITGLIVETQDLWASFVMHFTGIDPLVTQHLRYKYLLRVITDYSGRQRSLIGRLLVENSDASAREIGELLRWQGTIDLSWKLARSLAVSSRLYDLIGPHFRDAQSHYDTMYDMVKDIFYVPGSRHGTNYPIGVELWLELSSQFIDSLSTLKDSAKTATRDYVIGLEEERTQAIFLHLGILAAALFLCFYCAHVIRTRVVRPIHEMVEALLCTTRGEKAPRVSATRQTDEMGKLAQVLDAFQESGERYRALVQASAQIVWTWKQGAIDETSPIAQWWEATTGQPASAIATFGWLEVVHPDDREHAGKAWEDAMRERKNLESEYRLRARDGSYRHVAVRGVPLLDDNGKVREFIGSLNDITTRRQAEQDIKDSAIRLKAVFDTVLDGLITINNRGIIQSFNTSAEKIFGYAASEVIGKNVNVLMPEPYHREHDGYIKNYLTTGEAKIIGIGREVSARRKDGTVFPMELGIGSFQVGGELAFVGMVRDITARKEAEAKLLDYTNALERSNKELDDFAYIASHDLKEPLRGIHNHSRFLLEDNAGKLDKDSVEKLGRLVYLSQRMERLVNDLLYFSRLGRQDLAIQPTDLNESVRDIEETLELFLAERKARILVPQPLPTVVCDKTRITEVLRNLVTNAVKYNDKPERAVEIGFLPSFHSEKKGALSNVFYVRDNGRGIAPEFHEEIFRIFKRLQNSKDSAEEGTGVGLTFVKKIIERHGGIIFLESSPGQGTTFYFTLKGELHDTAAAA